MMKLGRDENCHFKGGWDLSHRIVAALHMSLTQDVDCGYRPATD